MFALEVLLPPGASGSLSTLLQCWMDGVKTWEWGTSIGPEFCYCSHALICKAVEASSLKISACFSSVIQSFVLLTGNERIMR